MDLNNQRDLLNWLRVASDIFKDSGMKNGNVEFSCPKCGGKSHFSRYLLQNNYGHKTMVKGYCEGCDIRVIS